MPDSKVVTILPNGHLLYRKENGAGGHTYYSDEAGNGVIVWDTCLVEESTLLAAIQAEKEWEAKHAGK